MTSALYLPLPTTAPSDLLASAPKHTTHRLRRACLSRRHAIALALATSLVTFLIFHQISADYDSDVEDIYYFPGDSSDSSPYSGIATPDVDYDQLGKSRILHPRPPYIALPVPDAVHTPARPKLRGVRELPLECVEDYFAHGALCHDGRGSMPIDIVWTWTNGSDPLFQEARQLAISSFDPDDPYRPVNSNNPSRMFRDHDELRHSLRSVLEFFRPHTNRFRIVIPDFDYPADGSNHTISPPGPGYWRLGLQPQFLKPTRGADVRWRDGNVQLELVHHAHIFEPYNHSIFNSYAIESQFSHLQDMSEVFVYMNDDFYMIRKVTPYTFYTQQYGLVLRMQSGFLINPDWPDSKTSARGEWRSMGVSNWLLSRRFGKRRRPYLVHQAKTVSYPLIQEMALIWPEWVDKTATHAFRETEAGDGDFYQVFTFAHFLVERAREALLWSWTVARIGALDDSWGEPEMRRAWTELGGVWAGERSAEIRVESGVRETLSPDRVRKNLKETGIEMTPATDYQFSSLDGYVYNEYGWRGDDGWPGFREQKTDFGKGQEGEKKKAEHEKEREKRKCTIKYDECFGLKGPDGIQPPASVVFQHVAFNKPQCGDCMIIALMNGSGKLGISQFLPYPERRSPKAGAHDPGATDEQEQIPHLPLVQDWRDGKFALRDVMKYAPEQSVRLWTMRLITRYRYVVARTHNLFEMMTTLKDVKNIFNRIDHHKDAALLCLNDDVTEKHDEISELFRAWQERRFSRPAAWEVDAR